VFYGSKFSEKTDRAFRNDRHFVFGCFYPLCFSAFSGAGTLPDADHGGASATVSTIKLAEPVFSAILAAAFFREIPTLQAVCGSIVIIFGIWWYLKSSDD